MSEVRGNMSRRRDLTGNVQLVGNMVTEVSESSTDSQYPSAKAVEKRNKKTEPLLLRGAPHNTTKGAVGQLAIDTYTGYNHVYKCVAVNEDGTYTWENIDHPSRNNFYIKDIDMEWGTADGCGDEYENIGVSSGLRHGEKYEVKLEMFLNNEVVFTTESWERKNNGICIYDPVSEVKLCTIYDEDFLIDDVELLDIEHDAWKITLKGIGWVYAFEYNTELDGALIQNNSIFYDSLRLNTLHQIADFYNEYGYIKTIGNLSCGEQEGSIEHINSEAQAPNSVAFGGTTGVKAYYIKSIDFENKKIYLTKTQPTIPSLTDHEADLSILEDEEFYEVGDVFSIISEFHYPACGTISEIDENRVITYAEDLPFTEVYEDDQYDGNTFNVAEKPHVGCVVLGAHSFNAGLENIVGGNFGTGLGRGGVVLDAFGTVIGYFNRAGYAAIALNALTEALGQHSLTTGQRTKTTAKAKNGVAGGFNTVSNVENQFVFGTFNIIDEEGNFVFILGNGKSDVARSNAFTVDKDGNVWLAGVVRSDKDGICLESDIIKLGSSTTNSIKAEKGICIGNVNNILATAKQSVQIGDGNTAAGEKTMQIGTSNRAPTTNGYVYQIGYANVSNFGQAYMFGKLLEAGEYEQVIQGRYNKAVTDAIYVLGNGTSTNKKNALVIKKSNDNAMFTGDIYSKEQKMASEKYVEEKVAALVNSAPDALDTLEELSKALGNDPSFATTVLNEIGKVKSSIVNSDWSQNDETASDYVKNRTHYEESVLIGEGIATGDWGDISLTQPFSWGNAEIVVNGEKVKYTIGDNIETEDLIMVVVNGEQLLHYYSATSKPLSITVPDSVPSDTQIQIYQGSVKQLDEKYIPESIARTADVEEILDELHAYAQALIGGDA